MDSDGEMGGEGHGEMMGGRMVKKRRAGDLGMRHRAKMGDWRYDHLLSVTEHNVKTAL